MRRALLFATVAAALAGGCAHSRPAAVPLGGDDSAVLVADVVAFVTAELAPATTTLVFDPVVQHDAFAASLKDAFVRAGYAIGAPAAGQTGVRRVRTSIRALDHGLLLRVAIGELELSRWYPRTAPGARLGTDAPLVVRRPS